MQRVRAILPQVNTCPAHALADIHTAAVAYSINTAKPANASKTSMAEVCLTSLSREMYNRNE